MFGNFSSTSCSTHLNTKARYILKIMGDSTPPCLHPVAVLKKTLQPLIAADVPVEPHDSNCSYMKKSVHNFVEPRDSQ